jgi:drug/metabolite transporter (DMT)-like permease
LINEPKPELTSNRKKAIIFINLFAILQFLYMVIVKFTFSSSEINGIDLALARTVSGFLVSVFLVQFLGLSLKIPPGEKKTMFIRAAVGTFGFVSYVYCIKYLPLGLLMIIYNTAPFWSSLLSFLFLGETLQKYEVIAMILGFSGIVIVALSKPEV